MDRPVWLTVLLAVAAFVVFRVRRGGFGPRRGGSAEAVLAKRYARGQITEDDHRRSRAVLREGGS